MAGFNSTYSSSRNMVCHVVNHPVIMPKILAKGPNAKSGIPAIALTEGRFPGTVVYGEFEVIVDPVP